MSIQADKVLDCTGLSCPMPIVKTKKEMDSMETGQILEVQATDKGAKSDLTAWALSGGHEFLSDEEENGILKFWLKKG